MGSNYKPIGDYIRLVDERNKGLQFTNLLGLSISKEFIPSVANIIGTDMENYKIIRKSQFACSTMQVRRDKKMPVALYSKEVPSIISQAYPIFEITDIEELLPEYLMMWFTRSEFDREACFHAVGGVRGSLEWEDFCGMKLPIPSIKKQREIVSEYNVIQNRIVLNNQLITKLEETAQAIYKQWFVDFEFPDENGKPYKSNGGEMVWCEELEKEIPQGWELKSVKDFSSEMKSGSTPRRDENEYWNSKDYPWLKTGELKNSVVIDAEEYISKKGLKESSAKLLPVNSVLIAMYGEGKTKGQVGYLKIEAATNQACCAIICENEIEATFLYYHLRINRDEIVSIAIGGAQPNLSKNIIEELSLIEPTKVIIEKHPFVEIMKLKESYTFEIKSLMDLQNIVLAKMTKVETEKTLEKILGK
ncbi:restriction endonuclease subunit S [Flavobacterium sp. ZT3R18]|uniref:restriction endonuclease subunit S n=1 Tax=Flavobacterium sp. ZT3R18 TaxID=2594429 RepID=UPI00117ADE53|nr:restriction endonuclease subunit S [Flavobacterium sp. ZT3R18]TRX31639.1 restriction endonuclease subunit S [Flavobacterium sp. ZT3R18]